MKRSLISPTIICLAALALLSGCSALEEDKVNYKSATKGPSLDVPPDLTQLRRDSRYALESTSATASGFASAQRAVKDAGTAANTMGDVRMERNFALDKAEVRTKLKQLMRRRRRRRCTSVGFESGHSPVVWRKCSESDGQTTLRT